MTNDAAHVKGTETSSICFSIDGRTLVTRGGDDSVKCECLPAYGLRLPCAPSNAPARSVWDLRNIRKPLFTVDALPNLYSETNVIFSPDDLHILTGVGQLKGAESKTGEIVVLSKEGLEVERRVAVGQGSIIRLAWHSRINQVCRLLQMHAFSSR